MLNDRDLNKDMVFIIDTLKDVECRFMWREAEVIKKSKYDLVTDIDYSIEKYIKKMIHKHYPKDVIIGEEYSPEHHLGKISWTIDPIDGTVNFAHAVPLYGIQVALLYEEEIMASAIYIPETGVTYWAIKGQGAYETFDGKYNKRLKIDRSATPEEAIIHMGDIPHNSKLREKELSIIEKLSPSVAKIRMHGAACIDFTYIATDRADGYIILTKNLWDICPGLLICKEAGAIVTNTRGNNYSFTDDGLIVSSNTALHDILVKAVM